MKEEASSEAELALALIVSRGGTATSEELRADFLAWINQHGEPTREKVREWIRNDPGVGIGIASTRARKPWEKT